MSYDEIRGFFPGVTYQLGNFFAAINLPLQASIAESVGGNYGVGIAAVTVPVLILVVLVTALGGEARGASSARGRRGPRRRVPLMPQGGVLERQRERVAHHKRPGDPPRRDPDIRSLGGPAMTRSTSQSCSFRLVRRSAYKLPPRYRSYSSLQRD
jgi:hypothetical protein